LKDSRELHTNLARLLLKHACLENTSCIQLSMKLRARALVFVWRACRSHHLVFVESSSLAIRMIPKSKQPTPRTREETTNPSPQAFQRHSLASPVSLICLLYFSANPALSARMLFQIRHDSSNWKNPECETCGLLPPDLRRCPSRGTPIFSTSCNPST
jgi:hypothetical protein